MNPAPVVKGWCPSAYRPMESGDGLLVRVRPAMGRVTADQMLGLCDLADKFGNGVINLTSRANLQVRGVSEDTYQGLIRGLLDLELLDGDEIREGRRNILVTPLVDDGLAAAVYSAIVVALSDFPELPDKMGVAVDTGAQRILQNASADFRFERGIAGLILRADGADTGVSVTLDSAVPLLLDLMSWFVQSGGAQAGRMRKHLAATALPERFTGEAPVAGADAMQPGPLETGYVYGVPFGQMMARDLADLVRTSGATKITVTPWRVLVLDAGDAVQHDAFVHAADDPILQVHACPGAPKCAQAHVATHDLARELALTVSARRSLHVSGCSKGCAHPKTADVTIIGEPNGLSMVHNGTASGVPVMSGVSKDVILKETRL